MYSEKVDKQSPLPRYVQARRYLEGLMQAEQLGPGDQLPSERELAARLGVSQMTMNRAIQEMVREGMLHREVGRGTFIAHQDGSDTHMGTLALVSLHTPGTIKADAYGSEVLRGVQSGALHTGWDLLMIQEPLYYSDGLSVRLKGRADGFLFMSPPDEALPALRRMRSDGLPFVLVGSSWPDEDIPAVDTDNLMGARLAVEHLVEIGHRRIGIIGAPENMSNSRDRHDGFRAALSEAGLECRDEWFIPCRYAYAYSDEERAALVRAVREPDAPTAFFVAGYILAVNAIEALQNEGIGVPDEVSVVGFDEKFSAAFLNPPLTTVAQPIEEMGERAVERLEAAIAGVLPESVVERLPTRLIVRQSTAPPRRT